MVVWSKILDEAASMVMVVGPSGWASNKVQAAEFQPQVVTLNGLELGFAPTDGRAFWRPLRQFVQEHEHAEARESCD
jgi:hypothetical protein